ncbi:MAG TPA: hypothetical protein PLM16_00445 [Candidatus Woesebacteria bacterium]|nr:hypothetical protein [Candidatus Woesebacteria bacterium]
MHVHVFGRATTAKCQRWPEAVFLPDRSSGFYDNFQSLTVQDMQVIKTIMINKFAETRYSDQNWKLN